MSSYLLAPGLYSLRFRAPAKSGRVGGAFEFALPPRPGPGAGSGLPKGDEEDDPPLSEKALKPVPSALGWSGLFVAEPKTPPAPD